MLNYTTNLVSLDPESLVDVYRCTKGGLEWCAGGWESKGCLPLAEALAICREHPDYEIWQVPISDNPWTVWNYFQHFPDRFIPEICSCSLDAAKNAEKQLATATAIALSAFWRKRLPGTGDLQPDSFATVQL
ncbi:MAG: hypothetical protein AB4352_16925 [Hormoscilla sp.]